MFDPVVRGEYNKPMWPSQYCWPEGFMRRWHEAAVWEHQIIVTPQVVQILAGVARNFITNIYIGREFKMDGAVPRLGADVPRWYGETIGFWDKDVLITWTSNIQGWTTPRSVRTPSVAVAANSHTCAASSTRRRSRTSAIAPAGSSRRNSGSVVAAWTRDTMRGEGASSVISHAAAESCIHVPMFEATSASHRPRNSGRRRGPQADGPGMRTESTTP